MLVVSRRINESIKLTGGITIVVTKVGERQVKLGIIAPPSIKIWRSEHAEDRATEEPTDDQSCPPV